MKIPLSHYFLLLITIGLLCSFNKKHKTQGKLFAVKGKITQTSAFCGGADMPDLIEKGKIPVPFPGKTIFVKSRSKNSLRNSVIQKITSDEQGNFEIKLPAGTYCVVEEYKTQKAVVPANNQWATYDSACIKQRWAACDYTLTVKDEVVTDVVINYHHECSFSLPCQNYFGPLPPAAAPAKGQ